MPATRDLPAVLNRRPARVWPDAFVHHGARALLLLLLAFLVNTLFPVAPVPDYPTLEIGMVPTEDVIAEVGFPIPKSPQQLESERSDAASSVAPLFQFDSTAADTMLRRVHMFGAALDSATGAGVAALLKSYGLPVTDESIGVMTNPATRTLLLQSLERTIRAELPRGIVSSVDAEDSPAPQWRVVRGHVETLISRDSVTTQPRLYDRASQYLPEKSPPGIADMQRLLLILFFEGSLKLDRQATDAARAQAREMVPTVQEQVLRGQRIVTAHEPVRADDVARMDAYQAYLREAGRIGQGSASHLRQLGQLMLSGMLIGVFGLLLLFFRNETYTDFRHVALMAALLSLMLCAAAIIANAGAPIELVPIAFPILVIAILWDGRLALSFALIAAALLGTLTPYSGLSARLLPLLGGAGAALSVRVVRRRSQGLVLGLLIALAYAFACVTLGLLRTREIQDVLHSILWGAMNGVACSLIALGFLPVFESFARITTDQTLLELADLNRPVLKRLSLEAAGTYAHSINVANLAEAAARAINANPILARVGAYYHDIGKIATPQYFIENQSRGRNPHEQMDPRHSASIVRQHVEDGIQLARRAHLPAAVTAFIPEHHGTQLIGYFYDQARKLNPDITLDPADFSYPGPKPQSKETAILMLADSCESATKVLTDPTRERIAELVERLTQAKMAQGQLDEAPLTLEELRRIQDSLATTLAGIYHNRIDYPATAVNPVAQSVPAPPATSVTSAAPATPATPSAPATPDSRET
jgi:putative nucleotidyltransferase with HDIG domain